MPVKRALAPGRYSRDRSIPWLTTLPPFLSRLNLRRWCWLPWLLALWLPLQGAWAAAPAPGERQSIAPAWAEPCCGETLATPDRQADPDVCGHAGSQDAERCDLCDCCAYCGHAGSLLPHVLPRGFAGLPGNACPIQGEDDVPTRYPPPLDRPPTIS